MDNIPSNEQANDSYPGYGVAFTSANPLSGYPYPQPHDTQQHSSYTPSDLSSTSPSSVLTRAMVRDTVSPTPMTRTASAGSQSSSCTAMSSADEDSDTDIISSGSTPASSTQSPYTTMMRPRAAIPTALRSPFTSPHITLLVGGHESPSKETEPLALYVHAELLIGMSPFFRAAFGSDGRSATGFKEANEGVMRLPEERPEDWALLLQWVYWRLSMTGNNAGDEYFRGAGGLWHHAVDKPLERYEEFRKMRRRRKAPLRKEGGRKVSVAAEENSPGDDPVTAESIATAPSVPPKESPPPIATPLTSLTTATAASSKPTPSPKPKLSRPPPPAFGPLIRLFILADKYALPRQLKCDICHRVRDVGRRGRCVPEKGDVELLWDGTPLLGAGDLGGEWDGGDAGSNAEEGPGGPRDADEGEGEDLKSVVLQMFAALNGRSFNGIFYPVSTRRRGRAERRCHAKNDTRCGLARTPTPTPALAPASETGKWGCPHDGEAEGDNGVHNNRRNSDEGGHDAYYEEQEWHPEFMKSLLGRMYAKLDALESAGAKVSEAGGVVRNDGSRVGGRLGDVGRPRRRVRFPSLVHGYGYLTAGRSGEADGMGGG